MSEFLRYVLWEFRRYFVLALIACLAAFAVLLGLSSFSRRKYGAERKFPWKRSMLLFAFLGYLLMVLFLTILRASSLHSQVNFHLFRAWREALNNFSAHRWLNVMLNIAMFCPLGVLLPFLHRNFHKWYAAIPAGFGLSLCIELLQFLLSRGVCDVDDLFCNTLGTAIGYLTVMACISLFQNPGKRWKPFLSYSSLLVLILGSVGSVFLLYQVAEFGNLPQAPAYSMNTGDTNWILACDLHNGAVTAPVYQTNTRTREDCDAFAEDFQHRISTVLDDISYYQEAAYYMDHGSEGGAHFLFVHYLDQGYEYSDIYDEEPVWADTDRKILEEVLETYGISLPASAEFAVLGDGWHSFTVSQQQDGELFWDGVLRVRVCEDGSIREIENRLLSYFNYRQVEIISPQRAYEQLTAGKFNDEGLFERIKPPQVSILSWSMEYRVDTKGFYQPVYVFEAASPEGNYNYSIVIPAIK